jgi:serine/threonine protein kinase
MELINKKYVLIHKIGSGSFGSIYKGKNIRTRELVAIKVEPINSNLNLLKNETIIYQYLNNCPGIPDIKWYGKDNNNYYMVINLLGNSLQKLLNERIKFSLMLTLKISIKIVFLLKIIHEKGLVHRDIKPENFLMGLNSLNELYLIDFGFCKKYIDNDQHIKIKNTHGTIGSLNYASIMSHKHMELSRRDDLESLGYMLFKFYKGFLPWDTDLDENEILHKKSEIINSVEYPKVLMDYYKYVLSMEFEETPHYMLIIDNFKREIEYLNKNN